MWQSQTTTFFDVRVVDSDASSYVQRDVNAVLSSIEYIKKQKYSQAAECVHASFTPFVVTADGALGVEGKAFMHLLSEKITATWHKSSSEVMGYVRARLMFAILRATNLCIRGSRVKWRRRMEIEDGAGLPYIHAGVTLFNYILFIYFIYLFFCLFSLFFFPLCELMSSCNFVISYTSPVLVRNITSECRLNMYYCGLTFVIK